MASPTARLLSVLELLQAHGRLSGPELARRLGVDGRTLRRYVARLQDMGIPVAAERGCDGHYRLGAGFKLPPMMFSDDEALVLSVGLVAAGRLGAARAAVESAQAKLERVMPERLKKRVRAVGETVALDLERQQGVAGDGSTLLALSAAAHAHQRVRIRYRAAPGDTTERDFDPYGLAHRGGRWYAVGMCGLRRALRSFRLDRVQAVEPVAAYFVPPADFDALGQVALGVATLPRAHAVEVLLKTDLASARKALFETIGLFQACRDGVLLRSQVDDLDWYARELARLPFGFEIRGNAALRRALRRVGERALSASAAPAAARRGSTARRRP